MNITEQTNNLIDTFEKSIADKEKQLNDLSWEIKVEKAQLKKLKAVLLQKDDSEKKKGATSQEA